MYHSLQLPRPGSKGINEVLISWTYFLEVDREGKLMMRVNKTRLVINSSFLRLRNGSMAVHFTTLFLYLFEM